MNVVLFGQDIYPAIHEELLNKLNNYNNNVDKVRTVGDRQELAFMQQEDENGVTKDSVGQSECFQCKGANHWVHQCPKITAKHRAKLKKKFKKQRCDGG